MARSVRDSNSSEGTGVGSTGPAPAIPAGFRRIEQEDAAAIAQRIGYFRQRRFVVAAFHPEAMAIIWKDGIDSGFGTGGWAFYCTHLLPLAVKLQADLTDQGHIGQDVLVLDIQDKHIYAAPRSCAEEFIATTVGLETPHRRCLCARPLEPGETCGACPAYRHVNTQGPEERSASPGGSVN